MNKKGYTTYQFDTIPSTNDFAKTILEKRENAFIYACEQSGGRGTKGRSFSSKKGGVYATKLDFYQNYPATKAFEIMAKTAASVCKTLESFGLTPCIKWPNDIYVKDKKISGILIENGLQGKNVAYSIVGVGVNVCNMLDKELQDIATTMALELSSVPTVSQVLEKFFDVWTDEFSMQDYLTRVGYLGQECQLLVGEKSVAATLLFVDEEGGLHAQINGEEKCFHSAEVSLRIK